MRFEKELWYDGIRFMAYSLEYPYEEGVFDFAKAMSEGYRDYLEGDFFKGLCDEYDADPERRKRYRHALVPVRQTCKIYREGGLLSVYFHVTEDRAVYDFGFTFDESRGVVVRLSDLVAKATRQKRKSMIYLDGENLFVFGKGGKIVEKMKVSLVDEPK